MAELVTYDRTDLVSTLTMDDGKVNVFSIPMLRALHEAFDQAEHDRTVVLLRGRPGYFSAGFDLKVFDGPREDVLLMLTLGATLAERILAFPAPVAGSVHRSRVPRRGLPPHGGGHAHRRRRSLEAGAERGPDRRHTAVVRHRPGPAPPRPGALRPRHGDRHDVRSSRCAGGRAPRHRRRPTCSTPPPSPPQRIWQRGPERHAATKLRVRQNVLRELRSAIDTELA